MTERRPARREHHGNVVVDEYEWLRDDEDPEVLAHLEAQDAWTRTQLAHLVPLREKLFAEVKDRTLETDVSVPVRFGAFWYYSRTREGQQYAIHARVPVVGDGWTPPDLAADGAPAGEEVLVDENVLAEGHDFFALGGTEVTADGRVLAYQVDVQGDERFALRFRNLAAGADLADVVEGTAPGVALTPDGEHVFYTTVDEAWRPHRVWRHRLGTPTSEDVLVLEEPDERYWVGVGLTRSQRFLQIELASKLTSEVHLLRADEPAGRPVVVWPRREGVEYTVDDAGEHLLVLHNDGAENFELAALPLPTSPDLWATEAFDRARAAVVVPHDPQVRLESVDALVRHAVLGYRRDATPRVAVAELSALLGAPGAAAGEGAADGAADGAAGDVTAADAAVVGIAVDATPVGDLAAGVAGGVWREVTGGGTLESVQLDAAPELGQPTVRVVVESFTTPKTVYDVVLATGEMVLRKQQPVLGGYDPADYEQRRDWALAEDGTHIPVSLVWRRDAVAAPEAAAPEAAGPRFERSGSVRVPEHPNRTTTLESTPAPQLTPTFEPTPTLQPTPSPLVLYGYGSYEYSLDPWFSVPRLSLLDRGVVFAVAHVRGGGELGRPWYDDGKMLRKRNSFTDFVAVGRHLVEAGWTTPDRLAAEGGSAGGLLVGGAVNLAPELFAGVHAAVPFVDPLTSILDPSLPLTVTEWEEWGDPLHDPEVYAYIQGYAPYENVPADASHYPPVLATTSLHDTRVLYVEPAKWVARLRAAGAPALLRIEMSAGHGGVSGRYARWEQIAEENAWLLDVLGVA